MAVQLNRIEMIALFFLAAAIGVPLQAPDRGLIPAVVIAIIVVGRGRLMAAGAYRNQKFEKMAEGDDAILVKNGVIQMQNLKQSRLTIERLFAELRHKGVRHLGEVKRFYFEAKGSFTLVREESPTPGLHVLPDFDQGFILEQPKVGQVVCCTCGNKMLEAEQETKRCTSCKGEEW